MADVTIKLGTVPISVSARGAQGPTGQTGAAGSLTNNSGVVTTVPAGATLPTAKTGHVITGGGGAAGADKGLSIAMANGTLSAIDIKSSGTGSNVRFFRADGLMEGEISSGNAWITAKWIGIYAGIYTDQGVIGDANYTRTYHPPTLIPHMFGIHADVDLAEVVRGANVASPKAKLYMMNDGYGYRLDMCNGEIRFPRADLKPFVGDRNSTTPAAITNLNNYLTDFPLVLESHNASGLYGFRIRSSNVPTIGEAWLHFGANGGLANSAGRPMVQGETGNIRIGNSTDATTINAIAQTVFEIAGVNVAYLLVGGFHPLVNATKDLGTSALQWRDIYLSGAVKVGGLQVVGARNTGWTAMTGAGSKAALAAAAAGTASATYVQAELQGALNRIAALEARLKSYDDAFFAHGLVGA